MYILGITRGVYSPSTGLMQILQMDQMKNILQIVCSGDRTFINASWLKHHLAVWMLSDAIVIDI